MIFKQKWQGKNCRDGSVFEANVPGNIQYDYGVAHGFGDVQYADNCKKYEVLENDSWEYITKLDYSANKGERVFFVTDGICYEYEIFLNGEPVYAYEGMFKSVELDLTDKLRGNDELKVAIKPLPKSKRGTAGTRDEANESCMPPVCYGWDWNPRLLVSGMWQDAYIETRGEGYIGNAEVRSFLNKSLDEGRVVCAFESKLPCVIRLFDTEGNLVHEGNEREFTISDPKLWWCNGQGEPYLYTYEISNEKESVKGHIGFKRVRLARNSGCDGPRVFPKGPYEAPITIELNGRKIFAKGSNWVNPDLFWGHVDGARYETLVAYARDCNMNIFRMWGGSGICKREFYDVCDKYGIMIWQEFMLACNEYIDKEPYMSVLESEATAILKKLRSHPCITMWCGGNELFNSWSGMDQQSMPLRLLDKLCYELDRERPFIMTSPLFGMAHGGYTFTDERQGGEVFNEFLSSFNTAYTEFGVPSLASADDLRRIIPADELFPPRDTPAWRAHHGYGAWGEERWLCLPTLEKYFGKAESLEELVNGSSWLQCEGYRAAFEEIRKQWPHCSMAINWCFDEPWITVGNNTLISYPTNPKPCYEYVKKALRPTLFSARTGKFSWNADEEFSSEIWLLNDSPEAVSGDVKITLEVGGESYELLSWHADADALRNKRGPTVRFKLPDVSADRLVLKLEAENGMSSEYTLQYIPRKHEKPAYRILNF